MGGQPQLRDTAALAAQRRADPNPGCSHRPSLCASCCHPLEVNAAWQELGLLRLPSSRRCKRATVLSVTQIWPRCTSLPLQNAFKF